MLFKYTDAEGYDYGLGLPLLTMIVVVLLTAFIMNFTTVGRKIYAMGATGNPPAASASACSACSCSFMAIWD